MNGNEEGMIMSRHRMYLLFLLGICTVALIGAVLVFIMLPSRHVEDFLLPANHFLETHVAWIGLSAGKLGHIALFSLLGALAAAFAFGFGIRGRLLFLLVAAFAIGTELLQIPIAGRSASVRDLVYDLGGFGAGYVLVRLIVSRFEAA